MVFFRSADDEDENEDEGYRTAGRRVTSRFYCYIHIRVRGLADSLDEVDAGVCFDDVTHVADLEGEAGLFEGGLHLALAKEAQVAALDVGAAVGVVDGELVQGGVASLDLVLVALQLLDGGLLRASDGVLLPGGGLSRVLVLDEQVSDADLGWSVEPPGEILFELRRVCAGGGVPL